MHAIVHTIDMAYYFNIFCDESRATTVNLVACDQSTPAVSVTYIEIALRSLTQSQMCLVLYKYEKKKKSRDYKVSLSPEYFVSFKCQTFCAINKQKGILLTDALKRSDPVFLL